MFHVKRHVEKFAFLEAAKVALSSIIRFFNTIFAFYTSDVTNFVIYFDFTVSCKLFI